MINQVLNTFIVDAVITGIVAGVIGTLVMDMLNFLFARAGIISKIDIRMIGRMAAGWTQGHFIYGNPGEMRQVANEVFYGYITHYAIGVSLALPYVLSWVLFIGGSTSPIWAIPYGIATTLASWLYVYPSIGFGMFGKKSPEGIKASISSLANHLFFGVGIAIGITLV